VHTLYVIVTGFPSRAGVSGQFRPARIRRCG